MSRRHLNCHHVGHLEYKHNRMEPLKMRRHPLYPTANTPRVSPGSVQDHGYKATVQRIDYLSQLSSSLIGYGVLIVSRLLRPR
jgi:hypothetical protein